MIFTLTLLSGLALFQFLIAWEAYWRIRNDTLRWTTQVWFSNPRVERSYQRRQEGVMVSDRLYI